MLYNVAIQLLYNEDDKKLYIDFIILNNLDNFSPVETLMSFSCKNVYKEILDFNEYIHKSLSKEYILDISCVQNQGNNIYSWIIDYNIVGNNKNITFIADYVKNNILRYFNN